MPIFLADWRHSSPSASGILIRPQPLGRAVTVRGASGPALSPTERLVLSALHRLPSAPAGRLASGLGLSTSTVEKLRTRFRREGLWAPWFHLDLQAIGLDSITLVGGLAASPQGARAAEAALPHILAANRIPGAGILADGQLFLMALPRTLASLSALEASLLEISSRGSGHPWLAKLEVAVVPVKGPACIDYARLFPEPNLTKSRRLMAPERPRARTRPPAPRTLSRREGAVLTHLLRRPEAPMAEAAAETRLSPRTYARLKSRLLSEGVLRPASRANLRRLGYRYNLVAMQRFRTVRSPGKILNGAYTLTPGSAPLLSFLSATRSVLIAPYKTPDGAHGAARAIHRTPHSRGTLAPPLTMLFPYEAVRRVAFGLSGDIASAWLLSLVQPPSAPPLREWRPPGTLVEQEGKHTASA